MNSHRAYHATWRLDSAIKLNPSRLQVESKKTRNSERKLMQLRRACREMFAGKRSKNKKREQVNNENN
jgi:hypothetical protein